MTKDVANALIGYFQALYEMNLDLITLCGMDITDNAGQYEKHIKNIIQDIPRLVPYDYDKKNSCYKINRSDGLLEFSEQLPFLYNDYQTILERHRELLKNIKTVRNQFEHKMHCAELTSAGSASGSVTFDITYRIGDERYVLEARNLIRFIKDLNTTFDKIQSAVNDFALENGKSEHLYYRRLIRCRFSDFNKIYESNILKIIGKSLYPF